MNDIIFDHFFLRICNWILFLFVDLTYQIVKRKFLPMPEWNRHYSDSSSQGCTGNGQTPPYQCGQLSAQTIAVPRKTKSALNRSHHEQWHERMCSQSYWKYMLLFVHYIYLVNGISDWWTAFKLRGTCRYVLRTQAEVVVGCLHGQRCSSLPCSLDLFQRLCRG